MFMYLLIRTPMYLLMTPGNSKVVRYHSQMVELYKVTIYILFPQT